VKGINTAMVERADRETTMEEIVVALRESRRDASRVAPFTVVGSQPGGSWPSAAAPRGDAAIVRLGEAGNTQNDISSTDIADLRDGEIERLLAENARLNQRIVFLLKIIEREQRHNSDLTGGYVVETDRGAIAHDVKTALQAELRPILLVLLRLLEKQHVDPATTIQAEEATRASGTRSCPSGSDGGGTVRVDRRRDR
jgi:hypothetical protein